MCVKKLLFLSIALIILYSVTHVYASEDYTFNTPMSFWSHIDHECSYNAKLITCNFYAIKTEFSMIQKMSVEKDWGISIGNRLGIAASSGGLLAPLAFTPLLDINRISKNDLEFKKNKIKVKKKLLKITANIFFDGIKTKEISSDSYGNVSFIAPINSIVGIKIFDTHHGLYFEEEFFYDKN